MCRIETLQQRAYKSCLMLLSGIDKCSLPSRIIAMTHYVCGIMGRHFQTCSELWFAFFHPWAESRAQVLNQNEIPLPN